jgi:hypothetical protein
MRKEYGKALRDAFDRQMKAKLPAFRPLKTESMYIFPGEQVYYRMPREPINCIIILVPSRTDTDEFTIEIGWSKLGRFPECMRPCLEPPTSARAEFEQPEYICRLSHLWGREDVWWRVGSAAKLDLLNPEDQVKALMARVRSVSPEEAKAAVRGPVDEAIAQITAYAVPYLDEFARSQGAV